MVNNNNSKRKLKGEDHKVVNKMKLFHFSSQYRVDRGSVTGRSTSETSTPRLTQKKKTFEVYTYLYPSVCVVWFETNQALPGRGGKKRKEKKVKEDSCSLKVIRIILTKSIIL